MATRSTQSNRTVTISRWRINIILLVAMLIIGRIVVQLGDLQVAQHETLAQRANRDMDYTKIIQPSRGTIRDSAGNALALDVERESLYAVPPFINQADAPKLALVLSSLLGDPAQDIQAKLTDTSRQWVSIKRWLEPEVARQIAELDEDGLKLYYEPRRFYPQGDYAASVIGAVNLEGTGVSGVEAFFDTELKGITGTVTAEWDPVGNPIWLTPPETQPASNGIDLELTIDPLVQYVIETELRKVMDEGRADSGSIIVMDPKTGAIRGMASYPTFDPNRYYNYDPQLYNVNPAITALYEPGSTFKIVTVAAGLESGAFNADVVVNDVGVVNRYGYALGNWNRAGNGPLTPDRVLYYSSNVGALLLNEITGADKFYKTVRDFGFGQPTGVDIGGEGTGLVKDYQTDNWGPIDLDTNSYGQGIAVTPLQQVRMMAAFGNDGKLMRPYVVQKRCRGDVCETTQPEQVGQPVRPEVAWTVRRMLINSANSYGGQVIWGPRIGDYSDNWLVPGYEICAKTGTSDVVEDGRYVGKTIGSVLGLAPAEDSRYAILVKIDNPRDVYGVLTAVPVYHAIVEQLLRYEGVPPNPDLVGPGQSLGIAAQP